MSIQTKINRYSDVIWKDQLPAEEEALLKDILSGEKITEFRYDSDSDYSLFLAYNAMKFGYPGCDEAKIQEFQGILRTFKIQELQKIPAISKVFRALNEEGIIPVLVKGAAFLCYYAPGLPRMMGDIDIYVPSTQFEKAVSIIYDIGFEYVNDTGYHIAVTSDNLDMDIHRYIYKNGGDIGSDIYERVIPCDYLGCRVYVLSPEDMLVHQLVNRGQDICLLSHMERHFKWIVDCYAVLNFCKPDPCYILERAKALNNLYYAELTLAKLLELFPDKFDNRELCMNDERYCLFLKCVTKIIRIKDEFDIKDIKGIKYLYRVYSEKWENARIKKIVAGSNKSALSIMLAEDEIYSAKDFIQRAKRLIGNSRTGVEIPE